jgi:hypothetical protein
MGSPVARVLLGYGPLVRAWDHNRGASQGTDPVSVNYIAADFVDADFVDVDATRLKRCGF